MLSELGHSALLEASPEGLGMQQQEPEGREEPSSLCYSEQLLWRLMEF